MNKEQLIEETIKMNRIPHDKSFDIKLNTEIKWVKDILEELENAASFDCGVDLESGTLLCELAIVRKHSHDYEDHLIIRGHVEATYHTPCVRCLKPTFQEIRGEIAICALPGHLENKEEFEDATTIFAENSELDIYFYEKGIIQLREIVREQLFMHQEPLPLHSEDCKGLCHVCGIDKNLEQCPHENG